MKTNSIATLYGAVKKLNRFCASLSGLILLFVTVTIFIDVILRYFFNKPSLWITEVSTYLFLYIIFLGTAYAFQKDLHIRVTFLVDRFSRKTRRWFGWFTSILAIVFCATLLWQTTAMTLVAFQEKWTTPTALGAPYALIYVSMVIGSLMLLTTICLHAILQILDPKAVEHNL